MSRDQAALPVSNVRFRQVQRLWDDYKRLCVHGERVVAAYECDPSPENRRQLVLQARAVDLAYKVWDQAHKECYGF